MYTMGVSGQRPGHQDGYKNSLPLIIARTASQDDELERWWVGSGVGLGWVRPGEAQPREHQGSAGEAQGRSRSPRQAPGAAQK